MVASNACVSQMWFGGGESDAGISDAIDLWRTPLARGGEPKLGMATKVRRAQGPRAPQLSVADAGPIQSRYRAEIEPA